MDKKKPTEAPKSPDEAERPDAERPGENAPIKKQEGGLIVDFELESPPPSPETKH